MEGGTSKYSLLLRIRLRRRVSASLVDEEEAGDDIAGERLVDMRGLKRRRVSLGEFNGAEDEEH